MSLAVAPGIRKRKCHIYARQGAWKLLSPGSAPVLRFDNEISSLKNMGN